MENKALAAQNMKGNELKEEWIIDSGTSYHMTDNSKLFHEYKSSFGKDKVSITNGTYITIAGKESMSLLDNMMSIMFFMFLIFLLFFYLLVK